MVTKMWPMSSANLSHGKSYLRCFDWTKKAQPGQYGYLSLAKGLSYRRGSWNYYVGFSKTSRNQGPSYWTHPAESQQQTRRALCCAWSSQGLRAQPVSRVKGQGKHFNTGSWEPGRTCLGCKMEDEAYSVIKILSIFFLPHVLRY